MQRGLTNHIQWKFLEISRINIAIHIKGGEFQSTHSTVAIKKEANEQTTNKPINQSKTHFKINIIKRQFNINNMTQYQYDPFFAIPFAAIINNLCDNAKEHFNNSENCDNSCNTINGCNIDKFPLSSSSSSRINTDRLKKNSKNAKESPSSCSVDVIEYDDHYQVMADLAHFSKEDISLNMENNILQIAATKNKTIHSHPSSSIQDEKNKERIKNNHGSDSDYDNVNFNNSPSSNSPLLDTINIDRNGQQCKNNGNNHNNSNQEKGNEHERDRKGIWLLKERADIKNIIRKIQMPLDANIDQTIANFNNGTLELRIPKNKPEKKSIIIN